VQIVLERATLLVAGDQPKTLPNFIDLPPLMIAKVAISYQLMVIAVTSMVLVGLLALFFAQTRVGRAMRACSINREAAALQGIPVSRMLAYAFALSAGLGAIAGVLITPTQFTAFNIGVSFAISGFIAAIVGGFGNPGGAFVGGILLGVAQAIAIVTLGSGFKNIAALSILLVFITIRPTGLFGKAANVK
jgi:branched-chain amino acid transport system permease protein